MIFKNYYFFIIFIFLLLIFMISVKAPLGAGVANKQHGDADIKLFYSNDVCFFSYLPLLNKLEKNVERRSCPPPLQESICSP